MADTPDSGSQKPANPPPAKTKSPGQKSSQERGAHTRSKKNPGKRPHQGGGSR